MNQSEWQSLAILVVALAFVLAATAIQRLLGRMATRRGAADPPAVPQVPATEPVKRPADPEVSANDSAWDDRRVRVRPASLPASRTPGPGVRRRARRFLRGPGGLRAAILAREILGPAKGLPGPPGQR
ncbi:MAG: hypothetical protein EHM71_15135 [Zetaproteobacteria bacterium]|nr:MAG: hypothetical protein EHM71_15135 [Zetaproteobacteria bacterium]